MCVRARLLAYIHTHTHSYDYTMCLNYSQFVTFTKNRRQCLLSNQEEPAGLFLIFFWARLLFHILFLFFFFHSQHREKIFIRIVFVYKMYNAHFFFQLGRFLERRWKNYILSQNNCHLKINLQKKKRIWYALALHYFVY